MDTFPTHADELGTLTIVDMYLYYDGPKLFSATDADGSVYYLVSCLRQNPEASSWMLTPLTEQTRIMLTLGSELREALLTPATGLIIILIQQHTSDATFGRTVQVTPALIPDRWLPMPGLPLYGPRPTAQY